MVSTSRKRGRSLPWGPLFQDLVALASVLVLTFVSIRFLHANSATAALAFLVLILAIATRFRLQQAVTASLASVLAYNFFFLPPIGAFTIADPQNWIALFAFLITAITASQLSSSARKKTDEARARQQELQRMYDFSRALILRQDERRLPDEIIYQLATLFGLRNVWFYSCETDEVYRSETSDEWFGEAELRAVAKSGNAWHDPDRGASIIPVQLGGVALGSLGILGTSAVSSLVLDAITQLLAITITRAKAQEMAALLEATRQNEQLKSTLLDAVAHEFKTPLTSVKAAATAVLSSCNLDGVAQELITVIDEETDRLTKLVSDAIEVARIGNAPVTLHQEMLEVREIVSAALRELKSILGDREVIVLLTPNLPSVQVDRKLSQMVMRQLIGNACKYSTAGSAIRVQADLQNSGFVQVQVCNAGAGIPPFEHKKIFEKFYRSPAVRTQVAGTGLGLSISREIIEAQGGSISVCSEPGQDTCFSFTLPVSREDSMTSEPVQQRAV